MGANPKHTGGWSLGPGWSTRRVPCPPPSQGCPRDGQQRSAVTGNSNPRLQPHALRARGRLGLLEPANDAIRALDGSDLGGRDIRVNEAQDRQRGDFGGRSRY